MESVERAIEEAADQSSDRAVEEAADRSTDRAIDEYLRGMANELLKTTQERKSDPLILEQLSKFADEQRPYLAAAYADVKNEARLMAAEQRQIKLQTELAEAEIQKQAAERDANLHTFEARVRLSLALILLVGAVGGVIIGLLLHLPAGELSQYLAPISGLAGIAVGYFFGRESSQH
jgi:hypothetical protein